MTVNFLPALYAYPNIVYAYSGREIGNLSHAKGDAADVRVNRARLAQAMGIDAQDFLTIPHVGSNNVLVVQDTDVVQKNDNHYYQGGGQIICNCHRVTFDHTEFKKGFDAVISNKPDLFPMLVVGDCVGLQLIDTEHNAFGLVHAGLPGCVNDIVPCTLELMHSNFGTKPEHVVAILPPSIRQCHYEVRSSAIWLDAAVQEKHGTHAGYCRDGHYNLHAVIGDQLTGFGVDPAHIHDVGICTACNTDLYFSNFAAGKQGRQHLEGRFASSIGIRSRLA